MTSEQIGAYLRLLDVQSIWDFVRPTGVHEPEGFELIGEACLRHAITVAAGEVNAENNLSGSDREPTSDEIIHWVQTEGSLQKARRQMRSRLELNQLRALIFDGHSGKDLTISPEFWRTSIGAETLQTGKFDPSYLQAATGHPTVALDSGQHSSVFVFLEIEADDEAAFRRARVNKISAQPAPGRRRGRPATWDWEGAFASAAAVANTVDGIEIQGDGVLARLERIFAEYFIRTTDDEPGGTMMREKANKFLKIMIEEVQLSKGR
ncbi:hypothetical protein F2P47_17325 [Parvibaculum sedimenti]|uniref:Uncharacterized protein n=1 Tax=Parvibaculum sedimenti TaxID=2608632 RepID=A0A6N6VHX0_9HYPH|nr:hypothetical protein [Parvibaculum sedimenti]KAB7738421.1 hypothetical protein F2P47_17325 [Parvibaculum sedimenti]